ncbi:MAG: hypothetical protein ACOYMN_01130 [Roseimicrobium sp.]
MKAQFSFVVAVLVAPALHAQMDFLPEAPPPPKTESINYTLLKPSDKLSEPVTEGERNPFTRGDSQIRASSQKGTSEENAIRERLEKLRVVGVSPGARGLRVMLGDMVLEPGALVPQVLPEQSVSLRVGRISSSAIELVWLEKEPTNLPERTLVIAVDLRPYVRYQLMGQPTEKNQWEKRTADEAKIPVARVFPDLAQTSSAKMPEIAQNSARTNAPQAPDTPAAAPAEESRPQLKPNPQWEKAMKLMDKLLPKEAAKP